MGEHPTVHPDRPTGTIEIDVELAPAIAALWTLGITIRQCCQYNELSDSAEISFPTASDMAALAGAVFPAGYDDCDELQHRISEWEVHDPTPAGCGWDGGGSWLREWDGVRWGFAGRVEFPASDLPTITERLEQTTGRV